MAHENVEHFKTLKEWEEIRGVQVAVLETVAQPKSIVLVMLNVDVGVEEVTRIDASDPGARARAISLGEVVHDALAAAECTWFDPVTGDPI